MPLEKIFILVVKVNNLPLIEISSTDYEVLKLIRIIHALFITNKITDYIQLAIFDSRRIFIYNFTLFLMNALIRLQSYQ